MIKVYCNEVTRAFTNCERVKYIYTYGNLVWPPNDYSIWYVSWTPTDLVGEFYIDGVSRNLSDYSGYFSWMGVGSINQGAFPSLGFTYMETNVVSIDDPQTASEGAFYNCSLISYISMSSCEYIGNYAFYYCYSLSNMSIPVCSFIGSSAFTFCNSLKYFYAPECLYIGNDAFYGCTSLIYISLPKCEYIGEQAFEDGHVLSYTVNLPECSYIGRFAFEDCYILKSISLPKCKYIGDHAFAECSSLVSISLPKCSSMGSYVFNYCTSLNRIYLGYSGLCRIPSSTVFNQTRITRSTGSIYVPSILVNVYKNNSVWSYFRNRIYPMS